jgi:hypothetical protein
VFGVLIFAYSQSPQRRVQTPQTVPTAQSISIERVVSTQQRINRYFHDEVVSKLAKCWGTVRGKGMIAFEYTYTKANGRWSFNRLKTKESTLPKGQDMLALKCMLNAVGGTSFQTDGSEAGESTFVLNWTWPVPFPANAPQLTNAMFAMRVSNGAGETEDCDGSGTHPRCYTCTLGQSCKKVCVGGQQCTLNETKDPKSPCTAQGYCASGGPYGVIGSAPINLLVPTRN